ncbi:MAG: hypothetical protein FWH10_09415 [Oscillospiraceae bacterium]|nr:hypothetical protein [Oscillospiraceae bacterium]
MNGEVLEIIFQISVITLSAIGGLFCIYTFCGFVFNFKDRKNLYIKSGAYLVLDVDEIGEKLEYYVRKIESDINGRYIYISKIILYSKTLEGRRVCAGCEPPEIYKICRILSEHYNNIIFLGDITVKNESGVFPFTFVPGAK